MVRNFLQLRFRATNTSRVVNKLLFNGDRAKPSYTVVILFTARQFAPSCEVGRSPSSFGR